MIERDLLRLQQRLESLEAIETGSVSSLLSDAYGHMTDGTTTSDASGDDTFRFRSSDGSVSLTVTDNDVTFGDNLDITVDGQNVGINRIITKSTNYTILTSDFVVGGWLTVTVTTSASDVTITLPAIANAYDATSGMGVVLNVKKIAGSKKVIIDGSGSETIDGNTTVDIVVKYDNVQLQAGASEWHIL